jgi:phosphotriesterase-related protein
LPSAATVQTTRGPVDGTALGRTLMHEHVFSLYAEVRVQDTEWDEAERLADAIAQVKASRAVGVDTIVDLTVYGIGRDVARVAQVAAAADVNIVVATGVYFFAEMPSYFVGRLEHEGPTFIEDLLVREIETGIFATGIRAAVLKCASDAAGLTADVETNLRATARAQRRTGVPLFTHSHAASQGGLDQMRIFAEEGVDPSRVIIGHCGDTNDLDYLQRLADLGCYLGMDRFGHRVRSSTSERVATVAALCERGYADRLVLSHDTNCWSDKIPDRLRGLRPGTSPAPLTFLFDEGVPGLLAAGVSTGQLDQMLIDSPRRILAGTG